MTLDLQPIDDPNNDCPDYGGPIVELPPDTSYGPMYESAQMPQAWHQFSWIKEQLWKVATGKGIRVAVLDTGYTKHQYGPEPVAARSFISGQSWRDGNGHGCIAPDDLIYTSNCGLQKIATFFDRMSGVAFFNDDGSVIKDISRYNIMTTSMDVVGGVPTAVRRRITHVHKLHHTGKVISVEVNGARLRLTPWHPVYVVTSNRGENCTVKKLRADELKVGSKVCLVPSDSQGVSDEYLKMPYAGGFVNLDEDMGMLLGLIITDGHVMKLQKTVSFSSSNKEHIDLFCRLCEKLFNKRPSVYVKSKRQEHHKTPIEARMFDANLWSMLVSIGFPVGAKSKIVDVPEVVCKSPKSVIASWFAGCIEGNGSISKAKGQKLRLTTGSEEFAKTASTLLKSIGIRSSVSICESNTTTFGYSKTWHIAIGAWRQLLEFLRVKTSGYIAKAKRNFASAVKSIEVLDYDGPMYDFTVDGSHNYVANGCIVSNTHCVGTVLCRRDAQGNSIGLAPDADLIVGKVLSDQGSGSSEGIAAGVRWAADQGAHVISMSLGGGGPDTATNQAIDYAWSKGCVVNAAAGNAGYNGANTIGWPAKYPNCLCCGAYAENGAIANFSSGGRELDWACPGSNIISFSTNGTGFRSLSGTSMATPSGSALMGCLQGKRLEQGLPAFTSAQQVRDYFGKVLKDAGAPGFDVRFGLGIPNGDFLVAAILKDLVSA